MQEVQQVPIVRVPLVSFWEYHGIEWTTSSVRGIMGGKTKLKAQIRIINYSCKYQLQLEISIMVENINCNSARQWY